MANHKSALKRIRRNEAARLRNRYQHKTARNAVRKLRALENQEEAKVLFPKVVSMIDKLAKRILVTRDKKQAVEMSENISKRGGIPVELPFIEIENLKFN